MLRRAATTAPAVWLVALLLLPALAWVLGTRQTNVENRPPTPLPDINRGTLRNEATFTQLDKAIVDRLPLRERAIEVRSRLAVDVFGDSPNVDVLIGEEGWLYYRPELRTCTPEGKPAGDPADAADILARTILASGRRAGVVVAGSKIVTHPEHLPDIDAELLDCVRRFERRIHERLAASPGGLDIQDRLDALERSGRPTFLQHDTHWSVDGRETFVRAVLDRIRPGLATDVRIGRGPTIRRDSDLGPFLGLPRHDLDPTVVGRRAPTVPFEAGHVAFVGDSQLGESILAPEGAPSLRDTLLPGSPSCTWPELAAGGCDPFLRDADVVVAEVVARNVGDLVNVCARPVAVLADGLRGAPARWERVDGARQRPSRITSDGAPAVVRIRTAGADVRDVPRLLRIPVRTLPPAAPGAPPASVTMEQVPRSGAPAPCATPSQAVAGGDASLFLPVPAGRAASELLVRLTAPAGAELGRPEEIVLDGRPASRR